MVLYCEYYLIVQSYDETTMLMPPFALGSVVASERARAGDCQEADNTNFELLHESILHGPYQVRALSPSTYEPLKLPSVCARSSSRNVFALPGL